MGLKRCCCILIVLSVLFSYTCMAGAAMQEVTLEELNRCVLIESISTFKENSQIEPQVSGSLSMKISPKALSKSSKGFSLEVGDTITFNCSYSPISSSVDFGVIAPDGYFYYKNVTSGSINDTIRVSQRGTYYLAVRNNSSSTVNITGFVNY